jgi:hypothetical protein
MQSSQLSQVSQYNQNNIIRAELMAQEEVYSYLNQRYNLAAEFTNTGTWSYGVTYSAANRIVMDYATYSATASYVLGNCVTNSGETYVLTGTDSFTGTFSDVDWSNLGPSGTMYYVTYPAPLFDYSKIYERGDEVYWNNYRWIASQPTPTLSTVQAEQYISISNVPIAPFPVAGSIYWSATGSYYTTPIAGTTYSIGTQSYTYSVTDTLPTNSNYWTRGDNRSQLIVLRVIEMTLYYLNKTLSPTNIPEVRVKAYKEALDYLQKVGEGKINSPVLQTQPYKTNVRFGGFVPKNNLW